MGDGDGWVHCAAGHRHWGLFGAAGLMLRDPADHADTPGDARVVLQHRSPWTHEGDTWGVPGGARDSHEDPVQAAVREAGEEAAISADQVDPLALRVVDHGGWSYVTVVATARGTVRPHAANRESVEVRWWPAHEVDALPLHPGLAATWPQLRAMPARLTLVVDAANVVGSRPDGWWHDRAGATRRLRDELTGLARAGVPAEQEVVGQFGVDVSLPHIVLVVEAAARPVAHDPRGAQWYERAVTVVAADHDGDSAVVAVAERAVAGGGPVVVVTADRGLRDRLPPGVRAVGPRWLADRRASALTGPAVTS